MPIRDAIMRNPRYGGGFASRPTGFAQASQVAPGTQTLFSGRSSAGAAMAWGGGDTGGIAGGGRAFSSDTPYMHAGPTPHTSAVPHVHAPNRGSYPPNIILHSDFANASANDLNPSRYGRSRVLLPPTKVKSPTVATQAGPANPAKPATGAPSQVFNVVASELPSKLNGQMVALVTVTWQHLATDANYSYAQIWVKGYHTVSRPQLVASGTTPLSFTMDATSETVSVGVIAVSSSGVTAGQVGVPYGACVLSPTNGAPPAPSIAQSLVTTPTGYQFQFNQEAGLLQNLIDGYNIYRNSSNNTPLLETDNFKGSALSALWTVQAGTFTVANGAVSVATVSSSHALAVRNDGTFANDQFAQATYKVAPNDGNALGVAVRAASGADTGYWFVVTSTNAYIFKHVAGVETQLATAAKVPVAGDVIRLEVVGTALTAKYNGTVFLTATDSAITTGAPGIEGQTGASGGSLKLWSGGNAPFKYVKQNAINSGVYTFQDANAGSDKTYYYWVSAVDILGEESGLTNAQTGTVSSTAIYTTAINLTTGTKLGGDTGLSANGASGSLGLGGTPTEAVEVFNTAIDAVSTIRVRGGVGSAGFTAKDAAVSGVEGRWDSGDNVTGEVHIQHAGNIRTRLNGTPNWGFYGTPTQAVDVFGQVERARAGS